MEGATLDELLQRIKEQLIKLGPIIDLEIVREPARSRTERGSYKSVLPASR
jgi:hypothetical protein